MPIYSIRLPTETVELLNALADTAGGRSAMVRRLVEEALQSAAKGPPKPPWTAPGSRRIRIRICLTEHDAAWTEAEAAMLGMNRSSWIAALIERRASGRPRFSRAGELVLFEIHSELRRIRAELGVALADRPDGSTAVEGELWATLRADIAGHMAALRDAFEGNLAYWDADR